MGVTEDTQPLEIIVASKPTLASSHFPSKCWKWLSELFFGSPSSSCGHIRSNSDAAYISCNPEREVSEVVEIAGKRLHCFYLNTWSDKCAACGVGTRGALNIQLPARSLIVILCASCEKELMTASLRNWLRHAKGRATEGTFTGPIKRDAVLGEKEA